MDAGELKARDVHRRVQRLKARYSPTAIYSIPGLDQPTSTPPAENAASTNPATSAPVAPATSTTPATSAASTQPATSNTPATPAPSTSSTPPAGTTSNSPSAATSAPNATSTSASPATSSTPATSSQPSSTTPSNSAASTPSATPAPAKQTSSSPVQQQQGSTAAAASGDSLVPVSAHQTATNTVQQLPASGSAVPSPSGSSVASGGAHTGTIVGVVIAVIVGVVGIVFAVTYFMRRARRDKDEEFSADAFRRQSTVLMDSEPPLVPNRGITPRPPSMFEQRLAQGPPASFGQQPYGGNNGYYGYPEQPSFGPGQVVAMPGQPMPPQAWTPDSSRPFFSPMGESPLGSPVSVAPYNSHYDAHGQFIRQPSPGPVEFLNRQPSFGAASQLNRQPSGGPAEFLNRQPSVGAVAQLERQPSYGPGPAFTRQAPPAGMGLEVPDHAHYVDLNRSSVSPFQAEQYAEISHQLNTAPPMPLPSPLVAAAAEEAITKDDEVWQDVADPRPLNVATHPPRFPTGSPFADSSAQADGMPKPPSPTFSQKSRIDSTPPTLPEIFQQRSFSPVTMEFPVNASSSPARPAPSPLAASVEMPSAPAEAHVNNVPASPQHAVVHNATYDNAATPRPPKDTMPAARPDTVYTMYDDDDAYGGI